MPPTMFDSHPAVSSADLEKVERAIGRKFPEAYKKFVLKYNGGRPEPSEFQVTWDGQDWADGWETNSVAWFVSFHKGGLTDFLDYYDTFKSRIPRDMAPIAHDPGGNLVLLAIDGPDSGKVYFWMQDYEAVDDTPPDRSNIGFIAQGFDQFLDLLH